MGQGRRVGHVSKNASGVCAIIPDYPPEKLDVKFVLEADDHETQAAPPPPPSRTALRNHHCPADRPAHQAEGAQRRAAAGARRLHGRL